ncbi:hypothetical protein LTR91_001057 [Friedmanniomyces endolithicus]|uniref:Major facilitator superfamily (MFS) profile domain-containing protein n=1 Tax=Friedmanniomyces endolithicus TaxID=329885 RepID=A0A4U0VAE7_9PEZI|nr:hypothetical protein LTS09_015805 [Friedmanniomyces endolithicus]KAK0271167.1 hypothetical protein LTR35_013728 [Friedmanniomyces endolithicus]KAK0271375.1 hypothetical protein LTS00_016625 [Friedmanniomyces endolithicus]KAK0307529.1 hypothetical protein LTR01_005529 [Friedmanniomyces endolithicus]KAK0920196.1 hypothetical protein LTR57_010060 [Friedmanniomyces endolithicus]
MSDIVVEPSRSTDLENANEKNEVKIEREQPHYPVWQWVLTVVGLYLGALLYGLDTTIAADVQVAVYERFDNIEDLAWVGLGFPMASVAFILLIGRLYSVFNIKWLLNTSILIFEVGSALCGAAPNMNALIVGRVIAGIGGSGMYIGALSFFSALGSPKKLVLYNALIGVSWGTGAILGPVVGGAFSVSHATWRWAFYINLPLAALFSPVYLFVTPSYDPRPDLSVRQKLGTVDWVGASLVTAMWVLFITTIAFSGSTFAWDSASSIALWVVSGATLLAFAAQQYFAIFTTPAKRLFPVHFLKSRSLIMLYIATACSSTANAVTVYYIPLLFVFTRRDDPLGAAVRLLPFIVVFITFVMVAGATLPLVGRYSLYYLVGGALILTGSALMFTVRGDTSNAKIYGYEILMAAGSGITFQNGYAVAAAKVKQEDKSNAIGFINTGQIGTTALALAIASCLYQNLGVQALQDALSSYDLPKAVLQAALGGAGSHVLTALPPDGTATAINAVAGTIARVFGMTIAGGALLLVASLAMRHEKINLDGAAAGG